MSKGKGKMQLVDNGGTVSGPRGRKYYHCGHCGGWAWASTKATICKWCNTAFTGHNFYVDPHQTTLSEPIKGQGQG